MDSKIKSMIKIIEEDADSFAKRAEMYYRARPELMSLVEETYRAYRALAERYDHATGALRQAHRTMAEAFPDQVPLDFNDDDDDVDDYGGGDVDDGDDVPYFFNPADLQKQVKGVYLLMPYCDVSNNQIACLLSRDLTKQNWYSDVLYWQW